MSTQTLVGVAWILGLGIVAVAVAAWLDWRSRRRAEQRVDADLARHAPSELGRPDYVSDAAAHRRTTSQTLTADDLAAVDAALAGGEGVRFDTGWVDGRLVNDGDRLVLTPAKVWVLEGVGSVREVLQLLERAVADELPILLATGALDPEVADLLVVNTLHGRLRATAAVLGPEDLTRLAELSGATVLTRANLQAGYVPHSASGMVTHVVQDAAQTTVVAAPAGAVEG